MNIFDTICLSGGGIKGFSFIGALDYLQNKSYIDINKINNWVGTSAGSMISYLFTLGYSIHDIGDFILDFNFQTLESEISIDGLLESHGLNNGIKIMVFLSSFLKVKYDLEDINFIDHFKLTNKKLTIIGTNFSKGSEAVFNYETNPTMSVITAIRISCSIPVLFEPVLFNGDYYVDGGLINNFPLKHCNPEMTLGLYIKNGCCNNLGNIIQLINGCIGIVSDTISLKDYSSKKYKIIQIDNFMPEFMDLELTKEKKLKIIKLGQTFAQKFLNEQESKLEDDITSIKNLVDKSVQTELSNINQQTEHTAINQQTEQTNINQQNEQTEHTAINQENDINQQTEQTAINQENDINQQTEQTAINQKKLDLVLPN